MWSGARRRSVARIAVALLAGAILTGASVGADGVGWVRADSDVPGAGTPVGGRTCYQVGPTGPVEPEEYEPTSIAAVTGNRRLTAAENRSGTITVLRWPSPSYANQVRYRTVSADLPDNGVAPNEGTFLGVVTGGRVRWLRDLSLVRQINTDDSSDAVETTYQGSGMQVVVTDVVAPDSDVLVRQVRVDPPGAASAVVGFVHLDPTETHYADFPTWDWCQQDFIASTAAYQRDQDAVVTGASGVGLAIGFTGASSGHQVGQDAYWTGSHSGPASPDAYDDAGGMRPGGRTNLAGSDSAPGPQVDAAILAPLARGTASFVIAAGRNESAAEAALAAVRRTSIAELFRAKRDRLGRWLAGCPLPTGAPPEVTALARRAYVSIWQATDSRGPIVASVATQSPYGEDWPRDSSFINHLVDLCGHHQEVAAHDRFLAATQVRADRAPPPGTSPLVPPGNWAMNYYADGTVGGPIPWEIDETGFGCWTLVDHFLSTGDRAYLRDVYPAVAAAADFLTSWRDPSTGLPSPAIEDDNVLLTSPASMHSAGPALLCLRSAVRAARTLHRADDASRWAGRVDELHGAIE